MALAGGSQLPRAAPARPLPAHHECPSTTAVEPPRADTSLRTPGCTRPLPAPALGLRGCPPGVRAFHRMRSLSAARGMASRPEQQLCAPTCPHLCTVGQPFGQFLIVLPGMPISSPCSTPGTSYCLPLLSSTWSQPTCPPPHGSWSAASPTLMLHTGAQASLCESQQLLCNP